jgi:hypothetical protein
MKKLLMGAVAVLGLGLGAPAFAAIGVSAEGGGEGYTGQLNDVLRGGPAWGVAADLQPKAPVGLELRYQGASNQLNGSGSIFDGPRSSRVIQNGAEALAKVSLARNNNTVVEPYLAGGIGATRYHLTDPVPGYQDDTLGEVPFSAGVNFHPGSRRDNAAKLNIGVRADYNFLFSDQFAPTNQSTNYGLFSKQGGDTYRGLLTLGGNF